MSSFAKTNSDKQCHLQDLTCGDMIYQDVAKLRQHAHVLAKKNAYMQALYTNVLD